jgi:type I restriction enzyme S subunit
VVAPHGVLFRGGAEGKIRKELIEENLLEAVIGLPANLFFGTGIPAAILLFSRGKQTSDVLFIDASREFEQGKNQNRLRDMDITKIVETYDNLQPIEKYAYRATFEEVKENEFNLNIPRYVDTFEEEERVNLKEVQDEIEELEKTACFCSSRIKSSLIRVGSMSNQSNSWALKKFGDIVTLSQYGLSISASADEGIPMLRMNNISNEGRLSVSNLVYVSLSEKEREAFRLERGDLLFNRTNSYDLVGKTALFDLEEEYVCASYIVRFKLDTKQVYPQFVSYFFNTEGAKAALRKLATKGVSQSNINPTTLQKRFFVPVPSITEQIRVVEILSSWDTAIEIIEKLIATKVDLKKGLVQQLLRGKKRFPGFQGQEWSEVRLKDVFERVTRKNDEGNTNVVTISAQRGFVKQNDFFKRIIASEVLDDYFLVKKGEFCYNKSYSNGYPWGATKRLNDFDKAVVTTLYICFGLSEKVSNSGDFFEQYFEAGLLEKGLAKIAHEGGRAHGLLNVTPSDFFNLKITIR